MTGSPAKAGIAGFAAMLGYLLFPLLAGGVADRHDRKRILIACDAIRLAAVGSIAVAGWVAHITYVQVLVAGFLLQALSLSAAMTVVAAGMAVTAATATALAPIRQAGRRDQPRPSWAPAPAAPGGT